MPDDTTTPVPNAGAETGPGGLGATEAAARLRRDGPNALPEPERRSGWRVLRDVLAEPMLLLLLAAAGVYLVLGDPREAALLGGSVLLVVALTWHNERRSERALQALRQLGSPRARVERDGRIEVVPAIVLVVGDRIHVAEGDRVPADARIDAAWGLQVDESMLTGESVPVAIRTDGQAQLHAGTLVVAGHGIARVTATGARTAIGRIGASLHTIAVPPTPMQREIRRMARLFAVLSLAACALMVVAYGATRGDWLEALLAGLTLAIATIPEEFPVVLTVFLALGAWRMSRHNALVRRMPAIEALGATTVLCVDKTGTLTENRMAVAAWRPAAGDTDAASTHASRLRDVAALACRPDAPDPMDRALREAAGPGAHAGLRHVREYPLVPERPVLVHAWAPAGGAPLAIACKGAPETVVALCGLQGPARDAALADAARLARDGLRVLGVAAAEWPGGDGAPALPGTVDGYAFRWLGLVGFADPLREGVPAAVAEARAAGIRTIMLTGDHADTARAIARQAGLDAGTVITGDALDRMDAAGLRAALSRAQVFARVRPEHKLRLVETLRASGEVVAMTGDGVNDAPALLAAHVGVAMGARGTDVAREAASVVLLDDDFVTIVEAVRAGRRIYDTVRRAVRYILAVHVPITGLALLPLATGGPMVLLPLHVVLVELIVDPACAFVFDREAPPSDLMARPPRPVDARLASARELPVYLGHGVAMFAAVVAAYLVGSVQGLPTPEVAALAFTALVAGNVGLILLYRPGRTFLDALRRPNPAFAWVSVLALATVLVATQWAPAAAWFAFTPPPPAEWLAALLLPFAAAALMWRWRRP